MTYCARTGVPKQYRRLLYTNTTRNAAKQLGLKWPQHASSVLEQWSTRGRKVRRGRAYAIEAARCGVMTNVGQLVQVPRLLGLDPRAAAALTATLHLAACCLAALGYPPCFHTNTAYAGYRCDNLFDDLAVRHTGMNDRTTLLSDWSRPLSSWCSLFANGGFVRPPARAGGGGGGGGTRAAPRAGPRRRQGPLLRSAAGGAVQGRRAAGGGAWRGCGARWGDGAPPPSAASLTAAAACACSSPRHAQAPPSFSFLSVGRNCAHLPAPFCNPAAHYTGLITFFHNIIGVVIIVRIVIITNMFVVLVDIAILTVMISAIITLFDSIANDTIILPALQHVRSVRPCAGCMRGPCSLLSRVFCCVEATCSLPI